MARRRSLPIERYNRFLGQAKRSLIINHATAQGLYRSIKARISRPPTAHYIREHPKVARRELSRIRRAARPRTIRIKSTVFREERAPRPAPPVEISAEPESFEMGELDVFEFEGDEEAYGEAET